MALQEIYEIDCVRTADGSVIRCYELRTHPLPGQVYAPEPNSVTEAAGLSGFAGVKLHQ